MLWHPIPPHFPPFPPRFPPFSPVFPIFPRFSPFPPISPHFPPFSPFSPFFRGPKKTWRLRGGRLPRPAKERLQQILNERPYIQNPDHPLQKVVEKAFADEDNVQDWVDQIEVQLEEERLFLAAAFEKFSSGKPELAYENIQAMAEYLGFPSDNKDIDELMSIIDVDSSHTISFWEFCQYVGQSGGCQKLFAVRRARHQNDTSLSASDDLKMALRAAGLDDYAQALWQGLAPEELRELQYLTPAQARALFDIRARAKHNHEKAFPYLQQRVAGLGFSEKDLILTLAWIRELAPFIIHIDLQKMLQYLESDTHYRNQFETGTSNGSKDLTARKSWEYNLFKFAYEGAEAGERVKYGVLNDCNDPKGVDGCQMYGTSYLVLKKARLRTTFSPADSSMSVFADHLAVVDYYAHVLWYYEDYELREMMKMGQCKETALLGNCNVRTFGHYKEGQIHGEVAFAQHVERLVVHDSLKGQGLSKRIEAVAKKHGFSWVWMDEEPARRKAEDRSKVLRASHRASLPTSPGSPEVKPGFCKQGCGRDIHPRPRPDGSPHESCCAGCKMGFHCSKECDDRNGRSAGCRLAARECRPARSSFRPGQKVRYLSASLKTWVPAIVTAVHRDGRITCMRVDGSRATKDFALDRQDSSHVVASAE